MDQYGAKMADQGPVGKAISALCGCACLAAKITLWVYLGLYAF